MTRLKRLKSDLAAIALLVVSSLAIFFDVLVGANAFYIRDLTRYYYPTKRIIREGLLRGEFPYWNPYYSAGQPMAANPEYEVFYPPQWLILLPDYDLGYRLHILVHLPIAAVGMYLLLRSLRLRIGSALVGAAAWTFGGLFMSLINLLPILFCAAWIPYVLLFARRLFLRPNVRDGACAVFFLAMQNLTAEPTTLVQTWFLTGCMALFLGFLHKGRRLPAMARNVALTGLLVALGIVAGAAQMFPAIDHVGDSIRSRPFEFSLVTAWSMPVVRPLELIYRNLFGHISVGRTMYYWGGNLYPGMGVPFLFNIYFGLLLISMIVAGFFVKQRGRLLLLLVLPISFILALGGHTPLFDFLYETGLAKSVRYPEKYSLMGVFLLIVFASTVFDRILRRDREVAKSALGFAMAATVFAMAILAFALSPLFPDYFTKIWRIGQADVPKAMELIRDDWFGAMWRGLALCFLLWIASFRNVGRVWVGAVLVLLFVDLAPLSRQVLPRMPRSFFTEPPIARTLAPNRSEYRIFHEIDWYGQSDIAKRYFSTRDAVYWVVRNGIFPMTPATWGFYTVLERDYDKTALLSTVDLTDAMWKIRDRGQKRWQQILMAMSGARYRARYNPYEDEWKRTGGRMQRSAPVRFEETAGNERYYFAEQLEPYRGMEDFIDRLVKERFPPKVAFVPMKTFSPASGRVVAKIENFNDVTLDVEASGNSYLVVAITPHKYWSATMDGKLTPLHVTNIGYQGVVVPKGRHTVKLTYRNTVVFWSVVVTSVSFVLLLATVLISTRALKTEA